MAAESEDFALKNKNPAEGWHVDRRVSITHLLATATLAVGLVQWGSVMDSRVKRLEEKAAEQRQIDAEQDAARREAAAALASRLDRIEAKLDRLIERPPAAQEPPPRWQSPNR